MCPLQDYQKDLQKILHMVQPFLTPYGQVLLITPPCVIDSVRHNDSSNASAANYARVCVALAVAENVHVLDLHTHTSTQLTLMKPFRETYFLDGLHVSEKGNKEMMFKLLGIVINAMCSICCKRMYPFCVCASPQDDETPLAEIGGYIYGYF
ncbi:hypothetical protein PsorP6_001852 [Peronosclerospora sorghi]|uniref:Uncharacterized protein n=1 Tax=Peronosclerospora sorghi TaxID=230839 RepID=A0ACC0WWH7_9STRA|nr:hypothetical protein PsorP6_001852 [Peronosclerospora sorghi]